MVLCLESEQQKWLKNSEGSFYTNVLFLLPLFPCFFDFAVGSTAILWTSAIYLVLCFEYDCHAEIILMTSSLEAELVNFPHATVWFQRTDLRAWCAHAHTHVFEWGGKPEYRKAQNTTWQVEMLQFTAVAFTSGSFCPLAYTVFTFMTGGGGSYSNLMDKS